MGEYRRAYWLGLLSFLFLCLISLYRQLSLHLMPEDPLRPVLLYIGYVLLLSAWLCAIRLRFTQRNMRRFLCGEIGVMAFWMTVRFFQDFLFYRSSLYLMRISGYWIVIPVVFIPLLGFYAALGLGKGESFRVDGRWYLLIVPALTLSVLMMTNELHHMMFRTYDTEYALNLYFHPNWGIYLVIFWAAALEMVRAALIYSKSRRLAGPSGKALMPMGIALLMPLYGIPYFAASFLVEVELIELSAVLFFLEAMAWESCVAAGLIPVNTQYGEVFHRSTVAMQLLSDDGRIRAKSRYAADLTPEQLERLRREGRLELSRDCQLYLHSIRGGQLIWQKDVSRLGAVVRQLRKTTEELGEEGALLREELRMKSEEIKTQAKNEIYDQLTREVGGQLALMQRLLDSGAGDPRLFRQLYFVGVYVKRRCSLRLIQRERGTISSVDLYLCLRDMMSALSCLEIPARLLWSEGPLSPDFSLFVVDALECVVEFEAFSAASVCLEKLGEGEVVLTVRVDREQAEIPVEAMDRVNRGKASVGWEVARGGYRIHLREGRNCGETESGAKACQCHPGVH